MKVEVSGTFITVSRWSERTAPSGRHGYPSSPALWRKVVGTCSRFTVVAASTSGLWRQRQAAATRIIATKQADIRGRKLVGSLPPARPGGRGVHRVVAATSTSGARHLTYYRCSSTSTDGSPPTTGIGSSGAFAVSRNADRQHAWRRIAWQVRLMALVPEEVSSIGVARPRPGGSGASPVHDEATAPITCPLGPRRRFRGDLRRDGATARPTSPRGRLATTSSTRRPPRRRRRCGIPGGRYG